MLEKIKLNIRRPGLEDAELLEKWMSSRDFMLSFFEMPVSDREKMQKIVREQILESMQEYSRNIFYIASLEAPFGLIIFNNIDRRNKNAVLSILIGEEGHKNKIYGVKIFEEAIKIAFRDMKLHKISGYVYQFNAQVIRLLEAFGGKREAELKDYVLRDQKLYPAYIYSLFEKDYPLFLKKLKKY